MRASASRCPGAGRVKGQPGEFVFDAGFDPAEHFPDGGLLSGRLRLRSPDCDDVTGSVLIENAACGARQAVPFLQQRRD